MTQRCARSLTCRLKASAFTATEPSYKRFEDRQLLYKKILSDMADRLFRLNNIDATIEFTFPDLLNQDRKSKLEQLVLSQEAGWLSKERCANIAAAELGIHDFKFDQEKTEASTEEQVQPISTPGKITMSDAKASAEAPTGSDAKRSARDYQ